MNNCCVVLFPTVYSTYLHVNKDTLIKSNTNDILTIMLIIINIILLDFSSLLTL